MPQPQSFIKDPQEVLDYEVDFAALTNGVPGAASDYLEDGETIESHTVIPAAGIVVDSSALAKTDTCVRVWLSGGTVGVTYGVTVEIVTSLGRTAQRTLRVRVAER